MKTAGISLCFFHAPIIHFFWLAKHAGVSSGQRNLWATKEVRGEYGRSVTIYCHYNTVFSDYTKYWCKGSIYNVCKILVKTPRERLNDRCSIVDDKKAGIFTVTMTSLREEDKDKYWCVIAKSGRNINAGVTLRLSHTVTEFPTNPPNTHTTANPSLTTDEDVASWWAALRWILFILMLSCLVLTHITAWRISAAKKNLQPQDFQHNNSCMYEVVT